MSSTTVPVERTGSITAASINDACSHTIHASFDGLVASVGSAHAEYHGNVYCDAIV